MTLSLLQASNSSLFVDVVAHGGNVDIQHTKVSSWDLMAGAEDMNTTDGRRYGTVAIRLFLGTSFLPVQTVRALEDTNRMPISPSPMMTVGTWAGELNERSPHKKE